MPRIKLYFIEEIIRGSLTLDELNVLRGSPSEGFETRFGKAIFQVLVVSMEFCESLLNQSRPKTASIISADFGENSSPVIGQGEEVVDDDVLGDSEAIEPDAIDASFVLSVPFVQEELLDATRLLCKGRAGGQEPAVSEHRLVNVGRSDRISEESLVWERGTSTFPFSELLNLLHILVSLSKV